MTHAVNNEELRQAVAQAMKDEFEPTVWSKPAGQIHFAVTCPSGQKVLLRKLDPLNMMAAGLLDDIDYFSKKLFPENFDRAGNPIEPKEGEASGGMIELLKDEEKKNKFFDLLDRLCVAAVVKPRLYKPVYNDDGVDVSELKGQAIPVTNLDFSDKMFIFNESNKPLEEIAAFRYESTDGVATMAAVQGVQSPSE